MAASASTASISGTGTSVITLTNYQGTLTAASANEAVCTVAVTDDDEITITGVAAGTANVTVEDSIGQSVTIAVTVS